MKLFLKIDGRRNSCEQKYIYTIFHNRCHLPLLVLFISSYGFELLSSGLSFQPEGFSLVSLARKVWKQQNLYFYFSGNVL